MRVVFWVSALAIAYVFVGYPIVLAVWAWARSFDSRARSRSKVALAQDRRAATADDSPGVSIIIAARNEGARLAARIENLLALDYPPNRRQIIVVSDGSTDNTRAVAMGYRGVVELVSIPRRGKAAALNAGVARAKHRILVFADARQRFAADSLRALVAPFDDPQVGGVSGELILDSEASSIDSPVASGLGVYWRYEKWLRRHESRVGSTLGVTGAIYALHRSFWRPLPVETLLDDVLVPMRAVLAGRRVIFEERAKAFDSAAASSQAESRRKVRTLAGNVQLLWLEPRLLVPFVNPVWLQFVSHKLARLFVPYVLLALLTSSIVLAAAHVVYAAALAVQCAFYLLAGYGAYLEWRSSTRAAAPGPAAARELSPWSAERGRKGVVNA